MIEMICDRITDDVDITQSSVNQLYSNHDFIMCRTVIISHK